MIKVESSVASRFIFLAICLCWWSIGNWPMMCSSVQSLQWIVFLQFLQCFSWTDESRLACPGNGRLSMYLPLPSETNRFNYLLITAFRLKYIGNWQDFSEIITRLHSFEGSNDEYNDECIGSLGTLQRGFHLWCEVSQNSPTNFRESWESSSVCRPHPPKHNEMKGHRRNNTPT